jgi:hypothetical protein
MDADGKPSTEKLEDFFKTTFKKEMPEFYQGTKASGGGAGGGTAEGRDALRVAVNRRGGRSIADRAQGRRDAGGWATENAAEARCPAESARGGAMPSRRTRNSPPEARHTAQLE